MIHRSWDNMASVLQNKTFAEKKEEQNTDFDCNVTKGQKLDCYQVTIVFCVILCE